MREPVIKFESYNIDKFIYSHNPIEDMDFKEDFNLDIKPSLADDLSSALLTVEAKIKAKDKYIFIRLQAFFGIGQQLKEEAIQENIERFLVINGTAIVFPYLRSTISMLSSLDSEDVIILPTINTTTLFNSNTKQTHDLV